MNEETKTENIISSMIKNKFLVLIIVFAFLFLSIILTGLQKSEYSSEAKILIIQEQGQTLDAYIASKASESVAKNLKQAITSSSFRNKVLENSYGVDFGLSNKNEKSRRKEWQKTVDVKIIPNTSIMQIKVFNNSKIEAEKLLNTVMDMLIQNHKSYHGGGDLIKLQTVDYPLTSNNPVRPNWFLNIGVSLVLALFFAASLCSFLPNKISGFKDLLFKKNKQESNIEIKKVFESNTVVERVNISEFLSKDPVVIEQKPEIESMRVPFQNVVGNDHYLKRK